MQYIHTVAPTVLICETKLPSPSKKLIMDDKSPASVKGESDCPPRRRSARLSSPHTNVSVDKMAPSAAVKAVKRSIVVKKIAPRKTTVPSEHNKENMPRLSEAREQNKKASTPGPVRATPPKPVMPSPILASSPPPHHHHKPAADPEDLVWSQKVRRSYSRLSDQSLNSPSLNSPHSRETLFGFEHLKTPEVQKAGQYKRVLEASLSGSLSGVSSFTSLLEGDDGAPPGAEPDLNIPGVSVVKEKRRRKKVQQINPTELDALSAKMNAEFEEAEGFELVVE